MTADLQLVPGEGGEAPAKRSRRPRSLGPYDFRAAVAKGDPPEVRHGVLWDLEQSSQVVARDELSPYQGNPRRGDVQLIAESLAVNGQYRPIVVNRGTMTGRPSEILAGNHTDQGAGLLAWTHIAVTYVDVDEDDAARIVLVDNKANDAAGYDDDALRAVLELLGEDELAGTGFTAAEYAELLAGGDTPVELTPRDEAPALPEAGRARSQRGDVWLLGPHRVWCGDATDGAGVALVLDGDRPDAVWTDPPYGVEYQGGTADALTIMNDTKEGLPALLLGAFRTLARVCRAGAPVYVAHADTERVTFEVAMLEAGLSVRQNLVWVKSGLVLGRSDYQWRHEPILEGAAAPDDDPPPDEDEGLSHEPVLYGFAPTGKGSGRLGRGGPRWYGDNKQTTVFEFPKPPRNADHPTIKPTDLIIAHLRNSLPEGGLVIDLFGGSGSTMIAAHHLKSRAFLVELDPRFVDVIVRRWQEHTGVLPRLVRGHEAPVVVDFLAEGGRP